MHRVKCEAAETFHRCVAKPHGKPSIPRARSFAELDFPSSEGAVAARPIAGLLHEAPISKSAVRRPGPEALP